MVVIVTNNAKDGVRGKLTKWLIEVKPGVFVGNISRRVREFLWDEILKKDTGLSAVMIYTYPSDQGYIIEEIGVSERHVCDFDGLQLIGNYIDVKRTNNIVWTNSLKELADSNN